MSCAARSAYGATAGLRNAQQSHQRQRSKVRAGAMPVRASSVVPVTVQGPNGQQMGLGSFLTKNRIIFIGERIDENTAMTVCASLMALEYDSPEEDIKIYINCTAGTQYCVQTILDFMDSVRPNISTVAFGCVAGPPTLILAAGAKGRRYAMPNSRIILSQPLGGLSGTSIEVKIQAKELNRNTRVQVALLSKYAGISSDRAEEFMARDYYMTPKEAMEVGVIDGVI